MPSTIRTLCFVALSLLGAAACAQAPAPAEAPTLVLRSTVENVKRGFIAPDTPPVLHIKSRDTVRIDTISHAGLSEDPATFFGRAGIPPDQVLQDAIDIQRVGKEQGWSGGHVLTGPIYVEGAEPGDMLEVRILSVEPRVPYGVNNPGPGGAAPGLVAERSPKVYKFDIDRNVAIFSDAIEVPLAPFMGIMAVAPPLETGGVKSGPPGPFGGNMDFKRLTAGATLYLPVFNPGALFVTGDPHAAQGDGEVSGDAIEASMTPTLQFIVHKGAGKSLSGPRAEDADNFYVLGLDPDLDVALTNAIKEAVKFLGEYAGLSASDAYSLCSTGVDFAVSEAVDGNLIIYGRISKSLFKTKPIYWLKK